MTSEMLDRVLWEAYWAANTYPSTAKTRRYITLVGAARKLGFDWRPVVSGPRLRRRPA